MTREVVVAVLGATAAVGCAAVLVAASGAAAGREAPAGHGLAGVPAGARGSVSAVLGRELPAYRVVTGLRAFNPAQRLRVRFSRHGVSVASGGGRLGMTLSAYGYAGALQALGPAAAQVSANRVSYSYGSLRAWYVNGPLGLEQGFDVAARPRGGSGPLTFSLALSGNLDARLVRGSLLLDGRGVALRYGGLLASDARGRVLRSWLELIGRRVVIRVDDRGAVYPLRIDPFIQQAELTANDGGANDALGYSVAVSGNTIVVGAPYHRVDGHAKQGAVYVFTMAAGGWANRTQTAELTASDGAAGDYLGGSVAVSGNTIVAGATTHKVGADAKQGAVYVFTRPAGGWTNMTQTAELTASDGAGNDRLGFSVAVSGNTIVAGAVNRKVDGHAYQGAVYLFAMPAGGWANRTQTAELTASDGAYNDVLGYAVAVSGHTVVAGAPNHKVRGQAEAGAVYVFKMAAGGWANRTQTAELTASDGATQDGLGFSVAVSGSTIVAGAPYVTFISARGESSSQGAAYVFTMAAGGWANHTQTAELTASDGGLDYYFGHSVAVAGDMIVAGGPNDTYAGAGGRVNHGAAYVFTMAAGGWTNRTQTAELTASGGAVGDDLGSSVAVSGDTIVAGAPDHKVGGNVAQGAAYVFGGPDRRGGSRAGR
jgi:hypothetical protein